MLNNCIQLGLVSSEVTMVVSQQTKTKHQRWSCLYFLRKISRAQLNVEDVPNPIVLPPNDGSD